MSVCRITSGHITISGARVREFGVNCSDLFQDWRRGVQTTGSPVAYTPPANYIAVMDELAANGIRFVRFLVTGFATKTYRVGFIENQSTFLANFDALVSAAESRGILLIPSLFFAIANVPPYYSETLRSYGDSASSTYADMGTTISLFVQRYVNSTAIAYWEFSNEADLRTNNPPTTPNYATDSTMEQPAAWTAADGWQVKNSVTGVSTCYTATDRFNQACHAADSNCITASGNYGCTGLVRTTINDYIKTQLRFDATDTMSIHCYPSSQFPFFGASSQGLGVFLKKCNDNYRSLGRPLIVGEFGFDVDDAVAGGPAITAFQNTLNEIMYSDVDIALVWEWRAFTGDGTFSISDGTTNSNLFKSAFIAAAGQYRL